MTPSLPVRMQVEDREVLLTAESALDGEPIIVFVVAGEEPADGRLDPRRLRGPGFQDRRLLGGRPRLRAVRLGDLVRPEVQRPENRD